MLTHRYSDEEEVSVTMKPPYRMQIFLPEEMRAALRDIAHEERTSLQQLVAQWLLDKIRQYPRYEHFSPEGDTMASP